MSVAADDLARRVAAFLPVQLPPPPQKEQLSSVAAAVLDAGGRFGRAVGDVFRRLRIDDTFYSLAPTRRVNSGKNGRRISAATAAAGKDGVPTGGDPLAAAASGRFARSQGSMNLSATYRSSAPTSAGDGASLFLVQLGPVLFVRDTTLLFPVHLSKRHLIWYGFERKNGVHSVCPAYWSAQRKCFFMSMICLNPLACSFMDMQFPNGQLRYVAGDGFTARAFRPLFGGILQGHGKFPGEKRLSFSFKLLAEQERWQRRSNGSVAG